MFEADLPTISYEDAPTPDAAHRAIRQAQQQGPIAMGAHGPELLSYELARTALRDHRLCPPPGLGLEAQGLTSGRLWDRVKQSPLSINGADHSGLRRLVSEADTPRSWPARQDDRRRPDTVDRSADGVGTLRGRRRHSSPDPVPVICALLGAPAKTGNCSLRGRMNFQDIHVECRRARARDQQGVGRTRRLRRRHGPVRRRSPRTI